MSEALKPESAGLGMSSFDVSLAGAVYVSGGASQFVGAAGGR